MKTQTTTRSTKAGPRIPKLSTPEAKRRRKAAGVYLKTLRQSQDMTQRRMAELSGLDYYTFVSQFENGIGRLPPELWGDWARLLHVDPKDFTKQMLAFYEPHIHKLLWPGEGDGKTKS